ncbi:MAG: hypothetical protein IKZ91_04495 [Bacteroidales bacterium]|nr:hypothetical protein [Bacteroidales bacterium]
MNRPVLVVAFLSMLVAFSACNKENPSDGDNVTYRLTQAKSLKRGVGYNNPVLPDEDVPLLGTGISWMYNWGSSSPSDELVKAFTAKGITFIPMLWNNNWNADNLRTVKQKFPSAEYILAFNEPNLTDQANMTPAKAAEYWPAVVQIAKELKMKIVAPALNYGTLAGYNDPVVWMDEFLSQPGVSLSDFDAIALHCYMPSAGSVSQFLDKFSKYGKPLWLTEFCNGNSNNISESQQLLYMSETLNMLEGRDDVQMYAWFMMRGGFNSRWHNNLLTSESPIALTDLGKVYMNFSTFDKNIWYKVGDVIPAEQYVAASGSVLLAPSTDGGVLDISKLTKDGYVEYQLDIQAAGTYKLQLRYQTFSEASLCFALDGEQIASKLIPNTEKVWKTSSFEVELPTGRQVLRISGNSGAPVAINWLRIK